MRWISLHGKWSHSKQKAVLYVVSLLIPEHFASRYSHPLFLGRQPTHWLRFKFLTWERYLLHMAQFIPHGAIRSFEIESVSFILFLTAELSGQADHHPGFFERNSIKTRDQDVLSGASPRACWLFETTESCIQKHRSLRRRLVRSESLSALVGLPLVVEPIIYLFKCFLTEGINTKTGKTIFF